MKKTCLVLTFMLCVVGMATAQSRLDGTSFEVSTYNLPDSVGTVRLVDTADSDCQSGVEGAPVGDDAATEACLVVDSGTPPVSMTFGAGPQAIGGLSVVPTVAPFAGLNEPIVVTNNASQLSVPLPVWTTPGDLVEFTTRTPDNSFPSLEETDYWGFSATGIQYPNSDPASEIGLPYDEELGNYTNFYFWFENADGPITSGYDIFLPVGIGVGRHPVEESREVLYILYSEDQTDEQTDTLAGGSLDFHSHGSILDEAPQVGNLLFLADNVNLDGLTVTGFGLGMLLQPPELDSTSLPGDCNGDGVVNLDDLACACSGDARDEVLQTLGLLEGDFDGDGTVAFADFLVLSTNFNQQVDGYHLGDIDCSGTVEFADFLVLSTNFNKSAEGAASVPEPAAGLLILIGVGLLAGRTRQRD